jgi:hypothetical protein
MPVAQSEQRWASWLAVFEKKPAESQTTRVLPDRRMSAAVQLWEARELDMLVGQRLPLAVRSQ